MIDKIIKRFAWTLAVIGILLMLLLGWVPCKAQSNGQNFPPDNGPYRSGQFILLPQNAVPMIQQATAAPTTQIGSTSYFYWIVTHDVTNARFSIPAGPFFTNIGPAALSATASIQVTWVNYTLPLIYGQNSANASPFTASNVTYDVLRTATGTPPTGACACAVATGVGSASATDTGTLGAYTVNVPAWPGNYPASGDLIVAGPKGSLIDGGPLPTAFPYPIVVLGSAGWAAAMATLPQTGGSSGLGGGTIDARNCTGLSSAALDFGTFTPTVPLTILLGPCVYNFNQILFTNPGGNILPFHMMGCGIGCSVLLGTNTTASQSLITLGSSNNASLFDVLFQDFAVINSGTADQDVFNFSPTVGNSLNELVFQRLWIGFGSFTGGTTGSAIKINMSSVTAGSYERILIDDNRVEQKAGLAISAFSLIGSTRNGTRITHNHFETTSVTVPSGTAISLASSSATLFPANVLIESNTVIGNFLTMIEADGAVGTLINANTFENDDIGTRNGIQMQVGTGTVHSSLNVTANTFNVGANIAYILKTTDASATAQFSGNAIVGTPVTVFSGFTASNLAVSGNSGSGLVVAGFGAAGANHNGGLVPDPGSSVHSPAFFLGDDNAFHAPTTATGGLTITKFQILDDNTTFTCAGDQNVCTETLTWGSTMGDTSYTVVCSPKNPSNTTGAQGLSYSGTTITSATQFNVSIVSSGSASKSYGGMTCWGIHQ